MEKYKTTILASAGMKHLDKLKSKTLASWERRNIEERDSEPELANLFHVFKIELKA